MNECKDYLANIYKSIKINLDSLDPIDDRATIQGLIDAFNKFYVSLFASKKGTRKFVHGNSIVSPPQNSNCLVLPVFARYFWTKADGQEFGAERSEATR